MAPIKMEKLDYLLTFYIGLGFFTTGITWSLYNSYVPIFLRNIIEGNSYWWALLGSWENTFIGFVMIMDNIAAITLQPWIGAKSDSTWTKYGRRMPYILVGVPIAAIFFSIIPVVNELLLLLAIITLFNVAMAIYRAPVVALMPDIIPSKFRSKANGVINLMGGIGAIYAFSVGSFIYQYYGAFMTFLSTAIIMLIALVILFIKVKEPLPENNAQDDTEKIGLVEAFKEVFTNPDRSGLAILLAILFWFFAYNVIETWFTTYGVVVLGVKDYEASRALTPFAVTFVVFAVPAGFIASKIGRKNTILLGLFGILACMIPVALIPNLLIISLILAVAGVFWACININSITIVWELATDQKLGAYTGLYYFFSSFAAIFGPLTAGYIFDLIGIDKMFWLSVGYFIIAIFFTLMVKSGEARES